MKKLYLILLYSILWISTPISAYASVNPISYSIAMEKQMDLPKKPGKKIKKKKPASEINWVLVIIGIVILLLCIGTTIWGVFFFQGLFASLQTNNPLLAALLAFAFILFIVLAVIGLGVVISVALLGIALIVLGVTGDKWKLFKRKPQFYQE